MRGNNIDHDISLDPVLSLANAVITQAAVDYKDAMFGFVCTFIDNRDDLKIAENVDFVKRMEALNADAEALVVDVIRFFFSSWFKRLTNIDATYLTERLNKTMFEETKYCKFTYDAKPNKGSPKQRFKLIEVIGKVSKVEKTSIVLTVDGQETVYGYKQPDKHFKFSCEPYQVRGGEVGDTVAAFGQRLAKDHKLMNLNTNPTDMAKELFEIRSKKYV